MKNEIVVGKRYKTPKGEKVTVTGVIRRKSKTIFMCSDQVARDKWGNAFVENYPNAFMAAKYNFLEV